MGVKTGAIKQEAVPSGVDAGSRAARRAWRERLNNEASRKLLIGALAAFLGGSFWGFSGTAADCSTACIWTRKTLILLISADCMW